MCCQPPGFHAVGLPTPASDGLERELPTTSSPPDRTATGCHEPVLIANNAIQDVCTIQALRISPPAPTRL